MKRAKRLEPVQHIVDEAQKRLAMSAGHVRETIAGRREQARRAGALQGRVRAGASSSAPRAVSA